MYYTVIYSSTLFVYVKNLMFSDCLNYVLLLIIILKYTNKAASAASKAGLALASLNSAIFFSFEIPFNKTSA